MGFGDIPACGDGGYSIMSIIPVRIAVKSKSYYYVIKLLI